MEVLSNKGKIENEKYVELAYAIDQDKQAWRQENMGYETAIQEFKARNKQLEDLLAEAHRQEFMGAGRWGSSRAWLAHDDIKFLWSVLLKLLNQNSENVLKLLKS